MASNLTDFDFSQSAVNEPLIRQLHRCDFIEDAQNIVLIAGLGTGKTHLAKSMFSGLCYACRTRYPLGLTLDAYSNVIVNHFALSATD